ncbi:MAG: deoxyguanosinetriphosphate triphosphohydrolase [Alphaproteobacteria bacterium]
MTEVSSAGRDRQAAYACSPERSRGRRHPEPASPTRTVFQRDRDRIVHSTAFRRLKHKTQVFVQPDGDHFRTRLTHSLEVAQIARSIGRNLGLDEDLVEALALAHDLGHPPFGHAGEDALDAAMGGFDHNEQSFRVVTILESRYADFDGLNLTWETLEGLAKHNGPLFGPVPATIAAYDRDLLLNRYASAEAQAAALADDIAYHCHDIDDGLRAKLFGMADLAEVPLAGEALAEVWRRWPRLDAQRAIHEAARRMVDAMVNDVLETTRRRVEQRAIRRDDDVRALGEPLVTLSPEVELANRELKTFLYARMYRHPGVVVMQDEAKVVVRDLFQWYMADPALLPDDWPLKARSGDDRVRARVVGDYIAGMTDNFAHREHARLAAGRAAA